ncbi:DNA polymerase III subunit alpha [Defluviicoccus vanus]|uniref:DNA polymerase III subunit alpha n=1 Tax=Defluviicoccus vanus TaxID=111831 RepID=A0A7H1N4P0_9PROT|nr:DNA polymerase III subunit alpha [Defluviicoccus vanus]QNT70676.1 DNA polymerase III subunit alpha [Defluviicoccus vanus]
MTSTATFIHLRLHSAYSLSEGAIRIKELPKLCRARAMPAVAITDTNNLFGALEFSATLSGGGIQPIIGCQLSLRPAAPATQPVASLPRGESATSSVVLLVQNRDGYANLLRLLEIAYTEPESSEGPQVTLAALLAHSAGMILLTGGTSGPVGRLLLDGKREQAAALLAELAAAFPDRLYLELMRHGLADEETIENALLELAQAQALPIVATNDVHFATPDLYEAHDALLCIAQGTVLTNPERRRLSPEHYLKSPAAMAELFADLPDAVGNTVRIARRCTFFLDQVKPMLPHFDCGPGRQEEDVLRQQAAAGLEDRLVHHVLPPGLDEAQRAAAAKPYHERLTFELDVICKMGFAGYFLVVAEFIQWAKQHEIPVGPGRGSGAGSVVAWALTITDLDPIRFGLLFERFLNPERVSMPDFDIDFCQDRRDEVIDHVQKKYGVDRVAQIITFGKLQARAVLRDVGRVLGMPYGQVDRICKLVPNNPAHPVTLEEAIKGEPQLQAMIAADETVARLVGIAKPLEGLYRHASTHAAGIVIANRPLVELVPLYRDPRSPMMVTGFNMKWVEGAGLVKFDFLGLKTLTVLAKAVELLQRRRGIAIDFSRMPLDDAGTYELLGRGDTVGVFQLESAGMRDVLRKLKPDKLEDIIAVVALYRPGPMDNIPSYIRRKHGDEKPDYLHPDLEGILRETYGIMIYQEQVMQIAQVLSGYTLGGADLLRRAMGKKIKEEMDKQRESFVTGATSRGVGGSRASHIFDLVAKFAGYGFNKSHAAAYALIAYQTAYMKANYPYEFFAASMTLDLGNSDKLNGYRQELDRLQIPLLPPDINASDETFTVEYREASVAEPLGVRYGLAAVKTVGMGAVTALVTERRARGPFRSLDDFSLRLDAKQLNKRQLENLARAGAFDRINRNRRQVVDSAEVILRRAGASVAERESNQMGLFAGAAAEGPPPMQLAAMEDWSPLERLKEELDAIGFYLSAHPLDAYAAKLQKLGVTGSAELQRHPQAGAYTLAGTVLARRERSSAKGNRYAFVQLSDPTGLFEITVFSDLLASRRELTEPGRAVLIRAQVQVEGESIRCTAQELEPIERAVAQLGSEVHIHIEHADAVMKVRDLLLKRPAGRDTIRLTACLEDGLEVVMRLPLRVALGPDDLGRLAAIAGVQTVNSV